MQNSKNNLYKTDRFQWIEQQKEKFRNGQYDQLDIDNLFWEIESMGSELGTLEHRLTTLILHLLKYDYQQRVVNPLLPEPYQCRGWLKTIDRTRLAIDTLVTRNPHIRPRAEDQIAEAFPKSRRLAVREMNPYLQKHQQVVESDFPDQCPWSFDQMMKEDWLP
ncbi:DUF29 domain-containing protein [Salinisphaera sp. G21_0]|uniref:DUF29 domain-containing protein n=1 Tax=Salinisphaera sp. G21_0 TaxID=2821094 RepID=UPI001ADB7885|nr:DUF29 domain-containing protein [Salinisphaera sp. G21_0]MBO9484030.1 DUF29 domain-containing protein [Salinisphaera sp. G21_0]